MKLIDLTYFDETINFDQFTIDSHRIPAAVDRMLQVLRGWTKQSIVYKMFTDGKTNQVFCCHCRDNTAEKVIFRVYGLNTELLVNRSQELSNWRRLSDIDCAAPLYATFANGIICGYMPGRTLTYEMAIDKHIACRIAQSIAKMHRGISVYEEKSQIFETIHKLIDNLPKSLSNINNNIQFVQLFDDRQRLLIEVDQLKSTIEQFNPRIVFSHNDLQWHNVLYDCDTDSVGFIDYEYSGFNYQPFDIGNHFCEYAGIDNWNFSRYPNKDYQLQWIANYMLSFNEKSESQSTEHLENMYRQVNICASIAHFMWSIDAFIRSEYSTVDFDFFRYGIERYAEYVRLRDQFL